nr:hypothetical protein [uncultured Mediterranean phage uvMED]
MLNGKKIYKVTNGVRKELSTSEYEQAKSDLLIIKKEQQARTDAETKKASGKQKLLDLGLTEEEVKALIGV